MANLKNYKEKIKSNGLKFIKIEKINGRLILYYECNYHGVINQRKNDLIKNKFCRENNIRLIRIPYWEKHRINKILKYLLMI